MDFRVELLDAMKDLVIRHKPAACAVAPALPASALAPAVQVADEKVFYVMTRGVTEFGYGTTATVMTPDMSFDDILENLEFMREDEPENEHWIAFCAPGDWASAC